MKLPFRRATSSDEGNSKSAGVFLDARIVDPGDVERAERHADSWRRGCFAALAVCVVLTIALVTIALSRRTRALVYRSDTHGSLTYLGQAGHSIPPSKYGVEYALAEWVRAYRSIPDGDPVLAQSEANRVYAMLAPGSSAYQQVTAHYTAYSPIVLNQKLRIHRSVTDVVPSQLTPLSYSIVFTEHTYDASGGRTDTQAMVTVTLAQPPNPPTNPSVAALNPNGVYISSYQGHWVNPNPQAQ